MDSPFSFHCVVCFEWFTDQRYPVVLPCGHTYICNECCHRLDRCMECRTPLTIEEPKQRELLDMRMSPSHRYTRPPKPKLKPAKKRRLPLPKNLVLMSLIEATQFSVESVPSSFKGGKPAIEKSRSRPTTSSVTSEDEYEDEKEKIKASTFLATSDCGTYAVATNEGLDVCSSPPPSCLLQSRDDEKEENIRNLFHICSLERDDPALECGANIRGEKSERAEMRLQMGDRVQIVLVEMGWAKLARGYGYVQADKLQLVKVGDAVDRACKVEALLRHLSSRRRELLEEERLLDSDFLSLIRELKSSLMSEKDHTIVLAQSFEPVRDITGAVKFFDADTPTHVSQRSPKRADSPLFAGCESCPQDNSETDLSSARDQRTSSVFCSPSSMCDGIRSPLQVDSLLQISGFQSPVHSVSSESSPRRQNPQPSSHESGSGAAARSSEAPTMGERSNRRELNFRTGMSGHFALLSSSASFHSKGVERTDFTMSNHTGISVHRRRRKTSIELNDGGTSLRGNTTPIQSENV